MTARPLFKSEHDADSVVAGSFCARARQGWQANPTTVEQASISGRSINYVEARVPNYASCRSLNTAGRRQSDLPAEWRRRRAEILELFREHVYGRSPGRPEHLQFQRLQENTRHGRRGDTPPHGRGQWSCGPGAQFEITLFLPNTRPEPVPDFLLINNRPGRTRPTDREEPGFWPAEQMVARGYAIAALQNAELAPDDTKRYREGVIRSSKAEVGRAAGQRLAALAAWGWGARRAMDYFETEPRIDGKRVAVVGHSRGGKAALWAGAEDERFALVVSNESGEGGAALSRRRFGETSSG